MHDPQDESAARVYVFHGTDSTQVLGPGHLMDRVRTLLSAAGAVPLPSPTAHPDIASRPFTSEAAQLPGDTGPVPWSRERSSVAEVSVDLGAERFWDRIEAGSFATWRDRCHRAAERPPR